MKKISIGIKPTSVASSAAADAWVNNRNANQEPTKRFTIDVPISLHQRVKSQCALKGKNMADVLRELLEQYFPEERRE